MKKIMMIGVVFFALLFIVIISTVPAKADCPIPEGFKPGDVIFLRCQDKSHGVPLLKGDHIGIFKGENTKFGVDDLRRYEFYEAVPRDENGDGGVWKTTLARISEWAKMGEVVYGYVGTDSMCSSNPNAKTTGLVDGDTNGQTREEAALDWIETYAMNHPYQHWNNPLIGTWANPNPDFGFFFNDVWYCSELIWAAYLNGLSIDESNVITSKTYDGIDIDFWNARLELDLPGLLPIKEAVSPDSILYDDDVTVYGDGLFLEIDNGTSTTTLKRNEICKIEEGKEFTVTLKTNVFNNGGVGMNRGELDDGILMNGLVIFNEEHKFATVIPTVFNPCEVTFIAPEVNGDTLYNITAKRDGNWTDKDGDVLCNYEEFTAQIRVKDLNSSSNSSSSSSCFLADTKIAMADDSLKNIQDIQFGDMVQSYDTDDNEWKTGIVEDVFHHSPEEMVEYYLILNDDLRVTPNHPIYLDNKWITAGELQPGDVFGGNVITSIDKVHQRVPTYNFEVAPYHTYNVVWGENSIASVVHNAADNNVEEDQTENVYMKSATGDKGGGSDGDVLTAVIDGPANGEVYKKLTFDAYSSIGDITSYEWRCKGKILKTGPKVDFTFLTAGQKTISLTVTDDKGKEETTSVTCDISRRLAIIAPKEVYEGETFRVIVMGIRPVDGAKVAFGDGKPEITNGFGIVKFTANNAGKYYITAEKEGYLDGSKSIIVNSVGGTTPSSCFLADTKIAMADDTLKNIQDIQVGDMVQSYDTAANEWKTGTVADVFHHTPEEMADYYLIINGELGVTPNHPIVINNKWITAGELKIGDVFGGNEIVSIKKVYEKVATYNFEVRPYHTYNIIWGNKLEGSIVHNDAADDPNNAPQEADNIILDKNPLNPVPDDGDGAAVISVDGDSGEETDDSGAKEGFNTVSVQLIDEDSGLVITEEEIPVKMMTYYDNNDDKNSATSADSSSKPALMQDVLQSLLSTIRNVIRSVDPNNNDDNMITTNNPKDSIISADTALNTAKSPELTDSSGSMSLDNTPVAVVTNTDTTSSKEEDMESPSEDNFGVSEVKTETPTIDEDITINIANKVIEEPSKIITEKITITPDITPSTSTSSDSNTNSKSGDTAEPPTVEKTIYQTATPTISQTITPIVKSQQI